jgi:hypothetical protein
MRNLIIWLELLGVKLGPFPSLIWGYPWALTKPRVDDFLPLISKCERRLNYISPFLSQAGRLELTNSVLLALPTYTMCSVMLPKMVIKQIDKYRRHCLWRGVEASEKGGKSSLATGLHFKVGRWIGCPQSSNSQ